MKKLLIPSLVLLIITTSCIGRPKAATMTPTPPSMKQAFNQGWYGALTAVAGTQGAIPTATPVLLTPLPTNTATVVPTSTPYQGYMPLIVNDPVKYFVTATDWVEANVEPGSRAQLVTWIFRNTSIPVYQEYLGASFLSTQISGWIENRDIIWNEKLGWVTTCTRHNHGDREFCHIHLYSDMLPDPTLVFAWLEPKIPVQVLGQDNSMIQVRTPTMWISTDNVTQ